MGSHAHVATRSIGHGVAIEDDDEGEDKEDEDEEPEQMHNEIRPSQLDDAPWTQPSQPRPRRRHSPSCYTPGTDALGKAKGKTRRC